MPLRAWMITIIVSRIIFVIVPSTAKLIYSFAIILNQAFLTSQQINLRFVTAVKFVIDFIGHLSHSARKSVCLINI